MHLVLIFVIELTPFILCIAGEGGVCIPGSVHYRGHDEDSSLWFSNASWCLPPQWLEHARFCNCSHRVSTAIVGFSHIFHCPVLTPWSWVVCSPTPTFHPWEEGRDNRHDKSLLARARFHHYYEL